MTIVKKALKWLVVIVVIAALAVVIAVRESRFDTKEYTIGSDRLPASFEGLRIAQISDLHNMVLNGLFDSIKNGKPDMIFLTGDLVSRSDDSLPEDFVSSLVDLAPTYYVTGNHEADNKNRAAFLTKLDSLGVNVLENDFVTVTRGEESIRIAGIADVSTMANDDATEAELRAELDAKLTELVDASDAFTLLLAHHPEYWAYYEAHSVDVVFSGHAHGGAVRLPLLGALWAPGQGFLPQYTDGVYESEYGALVVSAGIGRSIEPFHINCPHELVFVTLTQGSTK